VAEILISDALFPTSNFISKLAKCEAYKSAVNSFFKSCPAYYSGAAKDALDEFLKTPCN